MGAHQKLITEDLYKQAIDQLASKNKENRDTIRLRAIKNKVYNTIEQLEIAVFSSIKNLNTSLIKSICCINYLLN